MHKLSIIIFLSLFLSLSVSAKNNGNDQEKPNCQAIFCEGNNGNHYGQ